MTRHLWSRDLETFEKLKRFRFTKAIYAKRKERIEWLFGTAKEFHSSRYGNQIEREKLHTKLTLTFACFNMKKLAKIMRNRDLRLEDAFLFWLKTDEFLEKSSQNDKTYRIFDRFYLQSDASRLFYYLDRLMPVH